MTQNMVYKPENPAFAPSQIPEGSCAPTLVHSEVFVPNLGFLPTPVRGIAGQIAFGDSFHNDRHPDLRADYILANPPFNVSDWGCERLRDDKRWEYGVPPVGNANFAWVQHFLYHLAPRGTAGFVLANGSMSSQPVQRGGNSQEHHRGRTGGTASSPCRGSCFRSTQIPACLWFLRKGRLAGEKRFGETLFIDARKLGHLTDRTHRDLSAEDITRIADTYHSWRGGDDVREYADIPGFGKSAALEENPPARPRPYPGPLCWGRTAAR